MQRRKSASREEGDKISQLICCVKQRPALYNYKMAPQDRRRIDVAKGWEEVAVELGGTLSADECRKKWKNLRDTYHQYRLRKSKLRDCLEKWRYSKDLVFLADVYQPKLKSERGKYSNEYASSNHANYKIDEIKISSISSYINIDDSSSTSPRKIAEDSFAENDYEGSIEHVADLGEPEDGMNNVTESNDAFDQVLLYEESESNAAVVDTLEESNHVESKFSRIEYQAVENSCAGCTKKAQLASNNDREELDLFFQFLKSKIQKLPATAVTSIQIEFLNAVLRKEAESADS